MGFDFISKSVVYFLEIKLQVNSRCKKFVQSDSACAEMMI